MKNRKLKKEEVSCFFNPLALKYSQISRQFQLIQDSNKRCLEVYPGDFHHKIKFRDEIVDLMNKLAGGGNLLNALAKDGNLSREDTAKLKYFNQANKYLLYKFSEVVEQIGALNSERAEQQRGVSKMNMNEKLDYSNLSAVELKAIMLCQMNFEKKEGDALYLPLPYLGETS